MKKQTQGTLSAIKKLIWGKSIEARDLTTDRLDRDGAERLDPVPHAVTLGLVQPPSIEQRVRHIIAQDFFKRNPDYGLENEDDDDFGVEGGDDPLYDFERRHEAFEARKKELDEARAEVEKEKQRFDEELKKKRRDAYLARQAKQRELPEASEKSQDLEPKKDGTKT